MWSRRGVFLLFFFKEREEELLGARRSLRPAEVANTVPQLVARDCSLAVGRRTGSRGGLLRSPSRNSDDV